MRLVLIHPNYHSGGAEIAGNWPPAWVAYLVGALRNAGYDDIRFIDAMTNHIEDAELAKLLEEEDAPDMIMSTCITPSIYQAQRTLEMAKEIHPDAVTVLGGVHATFMYQQVLSEAPWIDFIVRGEGEEILCNLVRSVEAGTIETDRHTMKGLAFLHEGQAVATPAHPPIQDLDSLTPDWSILEWEKYIYIPLNTRVAIPNFARGCPFTCSFCSQWKFWRTYRSRSPKNFVDEIETLVKEHDVGFFILADEEPTIARKKFVALCEELIERDLGINWGINTRVTDILRDEDLLPLYRKAGLVHVSLGTEASAQLNLERFRKETTIEQNKKAVRLLKENGIVAEAQFIIGLENETPETIEDTYKWALDWDADMVNWNMYTPWPFSDLFKELGDKVEVHDYAKYNFVTPIMKPDMMERGEVLQAVMKNYRRFYMRKSFLGYPWIKDKYKRKYMMGCLKAFAKSTLERRFYDLGRINFWGQKDVDFGFDPSRIKGADADRGTAGTQANGNGHGPLVQLTDNRGGRDEFNDPELPQQDAAPAGLACGGGNAAPAEYIDPGDMKIRPVFTEPKMDEFSNPREWARKQARARAVSRGLISEDALSEDIDAVGAEAEAELQGD